MSFKQISYIKYIKTLCVLVILTGCTNISKNVVDNTSTVTTPPQLQQKNAQIIGWSIKAKIGIKAGNNGKSGSLHWHRSNHQQQMVELYGPFGSGRIKINVDAQSAELKDAKGLSIKGKTAEEVLQKRIGWSLPWERMAMWIRGLQSPDATIVETNDAGQITYLNEDIWHVDFQEYRKVGVWLLPRKLEVTSTPGMKQFYDERNNYLDDEIKVKVILKHWSNISSR